MAPGEALPADLARESKFLLFTRLGFVARGILYILIAALVLGTGRTEDLTGALDYVGHGSGRFILIGMAAGMTTYAFWRFADALFGIENAGSDGKAYRKRAAAGFIGAIYLFLAYKSARILSGDPGRSPLQCRSTGASASCGNRSRAFLARSLAASSVVDLSKPTSSTVLPARIWPSRRGIR